MTKFFTKIIFFTVSFFIFPTVSFAQVVINEVQLSPTGERFLELYNTSDSIVDLTGWYMQRKTATGSSFGSLVSNPNFEGKTIGARGYFVVSRDSLSSSNIVLSTLTLTESNTIQIKNSGGDVVDKIDWGSVSDCGSPCPPNPPDSQSIQRIVSVWIIASPTPGATNNTAGDTSNPDNSSGEVLSANTQSSSGSQSTSGGTTDKVSSPNSSLEILAGSDRTTSPGSPIWFQATIKKNTTKVSPELNWSFGDGNVGVGPLVSHTYKYPGDYVVVLSVKAGDMFSVSRLKVKVGTPEVLVSDGGEYLEISNKSNNEINLFSWKIENKGKGFIFQPNTIILSKSSIKLDKSLLKMKGLDNSLGTSLKNSLGEEVFSIIPIKEVNLEEVSKNFEIIKNEALVIQSKINNKIVDTSFQTKEVAVYVPNYSETKQETNIATNTENIIYEAPKSESFVAKLTNFIKRVFSR